MSRFARALFSAGGRLPLALSSREVGRVTIVACNGRIVAGDESESLRSHVAWLLRTRRSLVLNLRDVGFIDSSGRGALVRILSSVRQAHGDLKLCDVQEQVRKVLDMTRLTTVFDTHESEEMALAAFYRPGVQAEKPVSTGRSILCLDSNVDVLAYLRELLRRAGYDVQSSCRISDVLLLMRVTNFDLLLVGPDKVASAASPQSFRDACAKLPVIELGSEFSTSDAGQAGAGLLETIAARLSTASS
jgi:anti-sigma B factor antagonist